MAWYEISTWPTGWFACLVKDGRWIEADRSGTVTIRYGEWQTDEFGERTFLPERRIFKKTLPTLRGIGREPKEIMGALLNISASLLDDYTQQECLFGVESERLRRFMNLDQAFVVEIRNDNDNEPSG